MKNLFSYFVVLLIFISGCTSSKTSKNDFNIVLITIDTLRADRLSCYGYNRETSPVIDQIAENLIYKMNLEGNILLPNRYKLTISLDIPNIKIIELLDQVFFFEIVDTVGVEVSKSGDIENGLIESKWLWHQQ